MLEAYIKHEEERLRTGIPPLPLDPDQTKIVCRALEDPPPGQEEFFLNLLKNTLLLHFES